MKNGCRIKGFYLFVLSTCLVGFAMADTTFIEEQKGAQSLKRFFGNEAADAALLWAEAQQKQEDGALRTASKTYQKIYMRWPNSLEAPDAVRAQADILLARKKWQEAFDLYQYGIDNYANRLEDYSAFLQGQYEAAVEIMEYRRLPFLFGGFTSPELAIPLFEKIISNGPQWDRAPEALMRVGDAYQQAREFEAAITAYSTLEFSHPASTLASQALWQHIRTLEKLSEKFPNNITYIDRLVTATARFMSTYPDDEKRAMLITLRNALYEKKARMKWDEALFYEEIVKNKQAAQLSYEQLLSSYPKSTLVAAAKERLEQVEVEADNTVETGEVR